MNNAQRVNRALFVNRVMENADNMNPAGVHQQSHGGVSNQDGPNPNNVSGYNTLQQQSATMQQVSEEAPGLENGGNREQQQPQKEDDALTNSTQKGDLPAAAGSQEQLEAPEVAKAPSTAGSQM